jgi:hypothetical protein
MLFMFRKKKTVVLYTSFKSLVNSLYIACHDPGQKKFLPLYLKNTFIFIIMDETSGNSEDDWDMANKTQ